MKNKTKLRLWELLNTKLPQSGLVPLDNIKNLELREIEVMLNDPQARQTGSLLVHANGDKISGELFNGKRDALEFVESILAPHERRIEQEIETIKDIKQRLKDV